MIARSFRSVAWVAGVGAAALCCYMLSLQVAAERAELASVERRIVGARQAIRSLQTELGTRGRLQQLEQWNAEVLALSAPVSGQYLDNEVMLARLETRGTTLDAAAEIRLAAAEVPAAPQPSQPAAAAQPAPRAAVATTNAPATPDPSLVRRASLTAPAAAPARPAPTRTAAAAPVAPRTAAPAAPRAAAPVRPVPLLDEATLREIGAGRERDAAPGGQGE